MCDCVMGLTKHESLSVVFRCLVRSHVFFAVHAVVRLKVVILAHLEAKRRYTGDSVCEVAYTSCCMLAACLQHG